MMIPTRITMDRRRAETATDPRRGGGGGLTSRVRDHAWPPDPGGGAVSTVSPQWMKIDDLSCTPRSFDGMD